ncbi:hypothetical protein BUY49_02355 [Staphylococcus devriesei]|uniref:hypothetical protein n=1 Tax=Staphylococcus devriesei TaxID=586733 RepID=UPI000E68DE3B|nr:hypothetical protein [Staphylococcus devriesei]RIL72741.1 hypothetical protein BUY49_02355 [Staphylococcus devriesei]
MTLIISNVVMFIALIFVMCMWIKSEKKSERLYIENTNLLSDRTKLQRKLEELKNENDKLNVGDCVVELKDGVYLKGSCSDLHRSTYFITDDICEAYPYKTSLIAKIDAEKIGGRVLQYKPNLEVVE